MSESRYSNNDAGDPGPAAAVADGIVHVVAAALVDADGRVLLSRRHEHSHQGGLWEFPGGKLEADEPVAAGLARELHEELGVELRASRPLIRVVHHYDDRSVMLDVHRVTDWDGEAVGREGQPLAWVKIDDLQNYPMPAADVPIVTALQLPSTYVITPPGAADPVGFLAALDTALADGARLVQLRLFDLADDALVTLGRAAVERCHVVGARLLLNGPVEAMRAIGADGLHLNSRALQRLASRPVDGTDLLAASCHDPEDLRRATRLGVDFALLSPVLPTRSHPDAEPLGWARFAAWVEAAQMPVFALGGMGPDLIETAWRHGAQGVAGIRGFWPARVE